MEPPNMQPNPMPFAVPARLSAELSRVQAYWQGLKRGESPMPFWDDAKLGALPDLTDHLMFIEAFEHPSRFRLSSVGTRVRDRYGNDLEGHFLDEIDAKPPLEFLTAQASATVEGKVPTHFAHKAVRGGSSGYARLVLPLWGNGHIEMMLAAIEELK
jgi:hypothetical protein